MNIYAEYDDEAKLLSDVQKYLRLNYKCISVLRVSDNYHRGYPDLFVIYKGIIIFIELKDNTGKPSAHQKQFFRKLPTFHAIGGICKTIEHVCRYMELAEIVLHVGYELATENRLFKALQKELETYL